MEANTMLAVNGYYNGKNIVLDEQIEMAAGQKLMVIIETPPQTPKREKIDLDKYVTTTERGKHVEEYMEEMRGNDRI